MFVSIFCRKKKIRVWKVWTLNLNSKVKSTTWAFRKISNFALVAKIGIVNNLCWLVEIATLQNIATLNVNEAILLITCNFVLQQSQCVKRLHMNEGELLKTKGFNSRLWQVSIGTSNFGIIFYPQFKNPNFISMKITSFCNFPLVPPALIRIYWEIWIKLSCFVTLDCFTKILTIFACSHWVTPGDWASQKELHTEKEKQTESKSSLKQGIKNKVLCEKSQIICKTRAGFQNFCFDYDDQWSRGATIQIQISLKRKSLLKLNADWKKSHQKSLKKENQEFVKNLGKFVKPEQEFQNYDGQWSRGAIMGSFLVRTSSDSTRGHHGRYRNCSVCPKSSKWIDLSYLFGHVNQHYDH